MVTFLQEFSAKIGHLWCRIGPIFVNSYKVLVYDKVMITVDDALSVKQKNFPQLLYLMDLVLIEDLASPQQGLQKIKSISSAGTVVNTILIQQV